MGASSGAPTMGAGAGANLDLMSNANLAQMPQASFSAGDMGGMGGAGFGAFNSVDMAGSMPSTQMADFSGSMPTTPAAQAGADITSGDSMMDKFKAGFGGEDAKKLAKDLSGLNKQENKMSPVNTQASGAGGGQLPNYYAGLMGAQQPSGAMQAIQGSMPQMQQPMGIMGRI